MSPRVSITVQSEDIIVRVYNPDSSFSTDTDINSSTRDLTPVRGTVFYWSRFWSYYNWNWDRFDFNFTRRCPLVDLVT